MTTVLVTGACGLIGKHICSGLLKKGCEVIAVDEKESDYNMGKLHYTFIECGPTEKNKLGDIFDQRKIDVLIHAACTVDNDLGPTITEREMRDSAACDKFIYRYAMQENNLHTHVEKIILLSTDQVYEFHKTREPVHEDDDLKPITNYAIMKYSSEKALITEKQHHKTVMACIIRYAPVYTLSYTENLVAKITDPKDRSLFVYGKGQYGFQLCCVHNLVDFILCFIQNADDMKFEGVYNVSDKELTKAADIIAFMRDNHTLGTVVQKSPSKTFSKLKGLFGGSSKEEKTYYRYLDLDKLENNNMLDNTKAMKLANFRWDIHNTK
ncbi:MAG: NAD(P)-dependent oxidoreductase [Ruminococcus sp.]|nr:NAD(P)-dependent oxidoreductase [Ruminococcus sp.]MBR6385129.1 NAD(P)-dependent oxidoreductase [Ruminococcus sp.]